MTEAAAVGEIPLTKSLTFSANLVDIGAAVQVEVSHPDNQRLPVDAPDVRCLG